MFNKHFLFSIINTIYSVSLETFLLITYVILSIDFLWPCLSTIIILTRCHLYFSFCEKEFTQCLRGTTALNFSFNLFRDV